MKKSVFNIAKMDCPAEERLIRMKLSDVEAVKHLDFDIPGRKLTVFHEKDGKEIETRLDSLNLGTKKISTADTTEKALPQPETTERRILQGVLLINLAFFIIEITTGLISDSMGLVADSLDMLADASVYGMSLMVVGGTISRKKTIARLAGYFQISLAVLGFAEVIRRFIAEAAVPDFTMMMIVAALALGANTVSLLMLQKAKSGEAHMQASMIFTSNDIIINAGVILAGGLVYLTASNLPDLIIGAIVFVIVIRGAIRILKLG